MKKIGPILAIISGLTTLVFGILLYLESTGTIKDMDWLSQAGNQYNNASKATLISMMVGGALQFLLGIFALSKPRGFSAFILIILFALAVAGYIYLGVENGWKAPVIVPLVVNGLATIGMVMGFAGGNK